MDGLARCQICFRQPDIRAAGHAWILKCHGYRVIRPTLERAKLIWNAEQNLLTGYGRELKKAS